MNLQCSWTNQFSNTCSVYHPTGNRYVARDASNLLIQLRRYIYIKNYSYEYFAIRTICYFWLIVRCYFHNNFFITLWCRSWKYSFMCVLVCVCMFISAYVYVYVYECMVWVYSIVWFYELVFLASNSILYLQADWDKSDW